MPVDPVLKQDLMLIKDHFEREALKEDGNAALVPAASILRNQNDVHKAVVKEVKKYPAFYANGLEPNKATIQKIQEECIPCFKRIKELKNCDLNPRLDNTLLVYNQNVLTQFVQMFKNLNGQNPIETHLCNFYNAWNAQCIPDIRRAVAALTYLINDLRSFDLTALKENMFQTLVSLLSNMVVNISFNYDKFSQLVTDTLKCVIDDVRVQLEKLDPILPRESRFEEPPETITVPLKNADGTTSGRGITVPNPNKEPVEIKRGTEKTKEQLTRAWRQNEQDKQWMKENGPNTLYNPLPPADVPFSKSLSELDETAEGAGRAIDELDEVLNGYIQQAIERIDTNVVASRIELVKLLKNNGEDLKALNKLIKQILVIQGVISALKGLESSKEDYDPCGDDYDEARRFFTRVKLPNTTVTVETDGDPQDPDDVIVTIVKDQVNIDNPIIQDILTNAGVVSSSSSDTADFDLRKLESGETVLQAQETDISLFGCLGNKPKE